MSVVRHPSTSEEMLCGSVTLRVVFYRDRVFGWFDFP
jgi:hypothetical protein